MLRPFAQVDVFTTEPYAGNPVAVVLDATGIADDDLQRIARWTNLSETTFVLAPATAGADYRVRIFTTSRELPFAGHPTLGTCHAWLEAGGTPQRDDVVVQECGAGLVTIARAPDRLAFAAPPLLRDGPVDDALAERVLGVLGVDPARVVDLQWADNGPGWIAVLVDDVATLRALEPADSDLNLGVVAPTADGEPEAFELRAFAAEHGRVFEDPVTGSLNASVAGWLLATGRARAPYVARQGLAVGREGRIHVDADAAGDLWIGGGTVTCLQGTIALPARGG